MLRNFDEGRKYHHQTAEASPIGGRVVRREAKRLPPGDDNGLMECKGHEDYQTKLFTIMYGKPDIRKISCTKYRTYQ
jgi:hypothetical protein